MKKRIYLLLSVLLMCGATFAQSAVPTAGKQYYIGYKDTALYLGRTDTQANTRVSLQTKSDDYAVYLTAVEDREGVYTIQLLSNNEYLYQNDYYVRFVASPTISTTVTKNVTFTSAGGGYYYIQWADKTGDNYFGANNEKSGENTAANKTATGYVKWRFEEITDSGNLNEQTLSPAQDAEGVFPDAAISVAFTTSITAGEQINGIKITYGDNQEVEAVTGTAKFHTLTIAHVALAYDTEYTVTIPAYAIVGLTAPITWKFRTCLAPVIPVVGKRYNIINTATGNYLSSTATTVQLVSSIPTTASETPAQIFTLGDAGSGNFYIATSTGFLYGSDWYPAVKPFGSENAYKMILGTVGAHNTIKSLAMSGKFFAKKDNDLVFDGEISHQYLWDFVELPEVDKITLSSYLPSSSTNILSNAVVSVTFDAPITSSSLSGITIKDAENNKVSNVVASIVGQVLMIAHADFERGKTYTVTIPAGTIDNYVDSDGSNTAITWSFSSVPVIVHTQKYYIKYAGTDLYLTKDTPAGDTDFSIKALDDTKSDIQIFELSKISDNPETVNIMLAAAERFMASTTTNGWSCMLSDDETNNTAQFQVIRDASAETIQLKNLVRAHLGAQTDQRVYLDKGLNWTGGYNGQGTKWELIPAPATWLGTTSDWNVNANWVAGIPAATDSVVIPKLTAPKVYPKIPASTTVKSLFLKFGAEIKNQNNLTATNGVSVEYDLPRGRWNMITTPIAATVADFNFDNAPKTWIEEFAADTTANWSFVKSSTYPFAIGDAFIYWIDAATGTETDTKTVLAGTLASGVVSKELRYGIDGSTSFAAVGNPFLTSIDFSALATANSNISPSYLIWTNGAYAGYNVSAGDVFGWYPNSLNQFIAPLQSFIVEKKGAESSLDLKFNLATIQATGLGTLRASAVTGNKLDIIASNATASILTFVADRENGQDSHKLLSEIDNVPDIYTLKNGAALGANIIHTNQLLIPIGLRTAYQGNMSLTFNGMDSYDAQITFKDAIAGVEKDLTGLATCVYPFDYTPKTVAGQVVADESRFSIQIAPNLPTGFNGISDEQAVVYSSNHTIYAIAHSKIRQVYVYSAPGVLLHADKNVNAASYHFSYGSHLPEVCIVKLITENGVINSKLINK
ncbi:MAG: hypothetical protein EZS26_001991 [Candidatus Ordinivivax streblomastigis]|uniref:SbsA Ig-like domain-containing protein n=1 Tax=Candidatus Ordinivivax streblomastigis TaxID=2540710 RepID=A0A5M8P0B5_9BACT|nr:MAG: hypothetical protein EZS26_001991 [Candidatus Ordinivivax streblomastigis]